MPSVLVTGGNRGIGLELCRKFARLGYVVYMGTRSPQGQNWGRNIHPILIDVADENSIREAASGMQQAGCSLNVLVNNAAEPDWIPASVYLGALEISVEKWMSVYKTNVLGPMLVARHFIPVLARGSRIVNVMSGVGEFGNPMAHTDFQIAYAGSKSALLMTTFKLAAALQPYGIYCNAACPDWCRTDMGGHDATYSAEHGAESIIKACFLDSEDPPTGRYFRDGQEIAFNACR